MLKPFAYRPQQNSLANLHPLTKLLFLLLLITLISYHWLLTVIGLLTLVLVGMLIKLPLWHYRRNLIFLIMMALVIGLSRYLANEGFIIALLGTLRLLSYLLAGLIFTDTTAADDLGRAIAKITQPLFGRYGLRFSMLMELVLRSFTLIFAAMEQIILARRSRLQNPWRHPFRTIKDISGALISLVLLKAERLVEAMEIRHFDPDVVREAPLFTAKDFWITASGTLIGVLLFVLM